MFLKSRFSLFNDNFHPNFLLHKIFLPWPSMVAHAYNPSTREVEAARSRVQVWIAPVYRKALLVSCPSVPRPFQDHRYPVTMCLAKKTSSECYIISILLRDAVVGQIRHWTRMGSARTPYERGGRIFSASDCLVMLPSSGHVPVLSLILSPGPVCSTAL